MGPDHNSLEVGGVLFPYNEIWSGREDERVDCRVLRYQLCQDKHPTKQITCNASFEGKYIKYGAKNKELTSHKSEGLWRISDPDIYFLLVGKC